MIDPFRTHRRPSFSGQNFTLYSGNWPTPKNDDQHKKEDKRWEDVYENVYGVSSSRENLKQLDFFSIMGNHGYKGNVTAQLQYAEVGFQIGCES